VSPRFFFRDPKARFWGAKPEPVPRTFGFCFRPISASLIDHPRHLFTLTDPKCSHLVESGEDLGGHVWVDELMRETGGDFLFAKASVHTIAQSSIHPDIIFGTACRYQKIPLPTRSRGRGQIQSERQSRLCRCPWEIRHSRIGRGAQGRRDYWRRRPTRTLS